MSNNLLKSKFRNKNQFFLVLLFLFLFFSVNKFNLRSLSGVEFVFASNVEGLKSKIQEKNEEMEIIQKEIEKYKEMFEAASKESKNIKNEINILETNLSKIKAEIKLSQNRIDAAKLSLEELNLAILNTEEKIRKSREIIFEILKIINEEDGNSILEILLANNDFSDFFDNLKNIEKFEEKISFHLNDLKSLKTALEEEKNSVNINKNNLEARKEESMDRQEIQKSIQEQKQILLAQTKSQEQIYKDILNKKFKKQKELEKEIKSIEEEIKIAIDPKSLPKAGSGVLSWPLEINTITQYFGNTPFATQNAQIYGGMGHNGIDLRASIGATVKSSGDGKITGTGNTDIACRGASYGKWILVEHNNNLSTLYAHMSVVKVKTGDIVKNGQFLGYSGDTGYTTGPHLHFAVFASKAVEVKTIQSKVCGTMMTFPIAPYNGYLNPLSYL